MEQIGKHHGQYLGSSLFTVIFILLSDSGFSLNPFGRQGETESSAGQAEGNLRQSKFKKLQV